jgi:hypothetical protein
MPVVIDVLEFGVKYTKPLSKWRNSPRRAVYYKIVGDKVF